MNIRFLGAHNCESPTTSCICFLIDATLVIDAGGLTANLSVSNQQKLEAILLTHQHYDHIRDMPAIGMNFSLHENTLEVYSTGPVYEALVNYLLNDNLYINFLERPPE